MKKYEIKETKVIPPEQLYHLYQSVGWTRYIQEFDKLTAGLKNSLKVLTAWDADKLVGLVRAIGDGATILYVQDLLILPEYQNQGVGFSLMKKLLANYPQVMQKVLMTEEAPDVRHFYEKCGFISADQGSGVAFYRFE